MRNCPRQDWSRRRSDRNVVGLLCCRLPHNPCEPVEGRFRQYLGVNDQVLSIPAALVEKGEKDESRSAEARLSRSHEGRALSPSFLLGSICTRWCQLARGRVSVGLGSLTCRLGGLEGDNLSF